MLRLSAENYSFFNGVIQDRNQNDCSDLAQHFRAEDEKP